MASDGRPTKLRVDRDGVRIVETPGVRTGVWLLILAMTFISITLIVIVRPALHGGSSSDGVVTAPSSKAAVGAPNDTGSAAPAVKSWRLQPVGRADAPQPAVRLEPKPAGVPASAPAEPPTALAPEAAPAAPEEDKPAAEEEATDQPTGIALFPPPGTKPILRGILVPEDFQLPEGYVRHYQATDDGQRVPAILMFHPDYQLVNERGEPIPMPKDRVVPPEMVPPGLPVQMLEPPEQVRKPDIPVQGEQDTAP
ncbi:MAG: hypothetical protein ACHQ9S_11500 [Candidatus Binatia bacterium]